MSARLAPASLSPWQVRALRASDVSAVMSIEREIYPFPWSSGNFNDSLAAGYDAWVVETETGMIGYAVVMWTPDEVHLLNLSVAAAWQGQGVGRRLLAWLCQTAAARGAQAMFLEVRPSNDRARGLYDSFGFETVGMRKRYYPSFNDTREDALVMRLTLPAADEAGGARG